MMVSKETETSTDSTTTLTAIKKKEKKVEAIEKVKMMAWQSMVRSYEDNKTTRHVSKCVKKRRGRYSK